MQRDIFWAVRSRLAMDRSALCAAIVRRAIVSIGFMVACGAAGCTRPSRLHELVDARGLVADLRLEFTRAVEASNRAVMADTDDASTAAAHEAQAAIQKALRTADTLRPLFEQLAYPDEIRLLGEFERQFGEYRKLDDTILGLAVENTNLKAQRLLFGPVEEAATRFRDALGALTGVHPPKDTDALASHAVLAVREIQVIDAKHIAESDEAAMTRMEGAISALEGTAGSSLAALRTLTPPASARHLAEAKAALDRFATLNGELIALSRRNSNVRSLALALGRTRMLTAECHDTLQALQDAIAGHEFKATR